MTTDPRVGRPRSSSREILAEAACELFLERGYDAASIADIAARAGVSRSSFFNYFASKSDVLWAGLDERIATLQTTLGGDGDRHGHDVDRDAAAAVVRAALAAVGRGFAPDSLALAIANASQMGLDEELEREAAQRRARISTAVAARLRRAGADSLSAEIAGAAHGGAVLAAIDGWARAGAGRAPLAKVLATALTVAAPTLPAPVRQLRVVVRVAEFEEALVFYRDVLGMPEQESYQGDGGARVAILGAGRATFELSNAAQVALIDRVETDGEAPSDPIRIALEVEDSAVTTTRLAAAGARTEASVRETPWRSLNARVRGPGDLQLTLFQELDRT